MVVPVTAKALLPSAGYWSKQRILKRAPRDGVIQSGEGADTSQWKCAFDEGCVDEASYRLTVGEEIYISPASERDASTRQRLKERESAVIPPGQFAFLTTDELVCIPKDTLAFIALRTKVKFRGLVNVSGFHVDPGYKGRLIFAVFNAGPGAVHVRRGDPWFAIYFADLTEPTSHPRENVGYMDIPSDVITPIRGQFDSFEGLNKRIDENRDDFDKRLQKVERDHTVVRWAVMLLVGAAITLGVRRCSDTMANSAAIAILSTPLSDVAPYLEREARNV